MGSLLCSGIFTSQGFLGVILIALAGTIHKIIKRQEIKNFLPLLITVEILVLIFLTIYIVQIFPLIMSWR